MSRSRLLARAARLLSAAAVALCLLLPSASIAHDLRPGALALQETSDGRWAVRVTPGTNGAATILPEPEFRPGCSYEGAHVACADGWPTPLWLPELGHARVAFGVSVAPLDGPAQRYVLAPGETEVPGPAHGAQTRALAWLRTGAEHVVFGPDHVLFVLLVGWIAATRRPNRRAAAVAGAVTGFTLGHSVTLAATALGALALPPAAVEFCIASSIVLLARELLAGDDQSWTLRAPELVAATIGLVHGCGFGGALLRIGLPPDDRVGALLWFHLGVELAQLAVVAAAAVCAWAIARRAPVSQMERALAYLAGVPAAAWTLERGHALFA